MIAEDLRAALLAATETFKAGHDAGYQLGYREGFAAACQRAKELVDNTFAPAVEPRKEPS